MFSNIILVTMIKDLLVILAATAIVAIFLALMVFIICAVTVVIKCIISALIATFKPKNEDADVDYEDLVSSDRGEPDRNV
jgi:hypothetical protein